jgi:hypothetical protein
MADNVPIWSDFVKSIGKCVIKQITVSLPGEMDRNSNILKDGYTEDIVLYSEHNLVVPCEKCHDKE